MQSRISNMAFAAAMLAGCTVGNIQVDSVCIRYMEGASSFKGSDDGLYAVMNDNSRTIRMSNLTQETDLGEFAEMPLYEKEYSIPYSLLICHNDHYIFGLQLTLAMYREEFEGEAKLIEDYDKEEYFKELDEIIDDSPPRRMNFIGSLGRDQGAKCETIMFSKTVHGEGVNIGDHRIGQGFSKLDEINVYTDSQGIRSFDMTVAHNDGRAGDVEVMKFGHQPAEGDHFNYEFFSGKQLMGIEGWVEIDPTGVADDRLMALDFFGDFCARSQQLYFSNDSNATIADHEWGFHQTKR